MKFILASSSPQRRKLLKRLKIPFQVIPSNIPEPNPEKIQFKNVRRLVVGLAVKKAQSVANRFRKKEALVLGAGTLVVCKGKILGKPRDESHAKKILAMLSGRWQKVITGVCLISTKDGRLKKGFEETRLRFRKLDEKTLKRLAKKNLDKSGAYAIQKMNDRYVRVIQGSLDNVIGLPLTLVRRLLYSFSFRQLSRK